MVMVVEDSGGDDDDFHLLRPFPTTSDYDDCSCTLSLTHSHKREDAQFRLGGCVIVIRSQSDGPESVHKHSG